MEHLDKNEGIADELSTVGKGMSADYNPEDGTIRDLETQTPTSLGTPLDDGKPEEYPEGGLRAWLSVFGSFCGMMCCFGMMNTIGTFQAYISTHQLKMYSPSNVGWIFSIYLFVSYLGGLQVGQIFDAIGPRILVGSGSICLLACMFLLDLCTKYWHFVLVYGILGGVGTSLISTPCLASIGHFFHRRRGTATGLASCGGSIGGVLFPLMLQSIFAKSGFGWATRALGFVYLFLLAFANVLIRSRLPPKPLSRENVMPDLRMFKDLTLVIMTAGVFLIEWGMFMPITYITSFALRTGMRSSLAYQLLAIFNAGSFFGRWIPGHIADAIGRVNTTTLHIFLSVIATFAFWLPASLVSLSVSTPLIIVYAVVFGYSSGSNISLAPVCFGQLCKTEDYGRYMATCFTIVGFGMLVGIPIGGGILQADGGNYIGLICFTGACYTMGMIFFVWTRVRVVGWGIRSFY